MLRLFGKQEGSGELMASVPKSMAELAHRVCRKSEYGDSLGIRGDRITFVLRTELWPMLRDVRAIPASVLKRDREALQEVLARIAVSGLPTNPLLREEFGYLVHYVGEGNWQRGIGYVPE